KQVREQLGLPKITLSESSMAIGKEVADMYGDKDGIWGGHDKAGILDPVAKRYDLDGLDENKSSIENVNSVTNMSEVKGEIYYSILRMLFEDNFDTNSAYGHAANFLTNNDVTRYKDTDGNTITVPLKALYMGVGISTDKDSQDDLGIFY